ncbi:MAG TPA: hypothetical protein VK674_04715 [Candidatus Limnocylindria bacterium]|nr:hypothetical protein [Candidatus Limnocylindria bacterium]
MNGQLIAADRSVSYTPKEAAVVVVALGWVIALGSIAAAALIVCGWRGVKNVSFDWVRIKASFECR